jgi:hypothetical protein
MPYPFASFASFTFLHTERPIWDTDPGWQNTLSISRNLPLGAQRPTILNLGSQAERSFDVWMSPARLAALSGLLGTTGTFVDWDRPLPGRRQAYLSGVSTTTNIATMDNRPGDPTDTTQRRQRVRITLVAQ